MVNEILNPCWNNKAVTLKQGWISAGRNLFLPWRRFKLVLASLKPV